MNIEHIAANPDIQAMRSELAQIDARLDEIRRATDMQSLIERDTLFIRWGRLKTKYDTELRKMMGLA